MKRFLTSVEPRSCPSKSSKPSKPKQQRLSQCKKVVKLKASKFVICPEELKSLRGVLDSPASTNEEVLHALRHLDSLMLHSGELTNSQVGKSVKNLRKHSSVEVSTLSARLTDKWRDIVLAELS
jgi:hypothetical protein